MLKSCLAAVAAFGLTTSVALAQTSTTDSTTSSETTAAPPVAGSYDATKSQKVVTPDGSETDKNQTYSAGPNGTRATTDQQTSSPDGSAVTTSHEQVTAPPPAATTTTTSGTTTTTTPQ